MRRSCSTRKHVFLGRTGCDAAVARWKSAMLATVDLVRTRSRTLGAFLLIGLLSGCANPNEKFGRTWYIDGAGNWGFGAVGVPAGLEDRGYRGAVTNHRWSLTFNPALD